MLIGHSRPQDITWTVSGTGAAILSDAALLTDDKPDTLAALRWLSGTQNTSSIFRLRANWTTPQAVKIVGLSNIRLPVGTKVQVSFRRSTDAAGTYPYAPTMLATLQRVMAGTMGERTAWLIPQSTLSDIVGAEFQIYNDVNGVASIVASSTFYVGEAWISSGTEICPAPGASIEPVDPTVVNRPSGQPYVVPDVPYRRLTAKFRTAKEGDYFGATGTDYESLIAEINRGQTCLYMLRYRDAALAYSPQLAHRYAMIGVATKLPVISHVQGRIFSSGDLNVTESPIPP